MRPPTIEQMPPREEERAPSKMELVLMRHGQAESQDKNAALSEQGMEQATGAARALIERIAASGGGIIKLVTSPVRRARETGEVIRRTMIELLSDDKYNNVKLLESRANVREPLKAAGLMPTIQALDRENPVQFWLEHPNVVPGKTPADMSVPIEKIVATMQQVAQKIKADVPVYYVAVTHEIPQAALLNAMTGETLTDFGGAIKNCEAITVDVTGIPGISPTFTFRDHSGIIPVEN